MSHPGGGDAEGGALPQSSSGRDRKTMLAPHVFCKDNHCHHQSVSQAWNSSVVESSVKMHAALPKLLEWRSETRTDPREEGRALNFEVQILDQRDSDGLCS